MIRFIQGQSPTIGIVKCHDIEQCEMLYDLFLDGKIAGRYTFPELIKKLQEVINEI